MMRNVLSIALLSVASCWAGAQQRYTIEPIPLLQGHTESYGHAINNLGDVVGMTREGLGPTYPGYLTIGAQTTLIEPVGGYSQVLSTSINGSGQVAGYMSASANGQAFRHYNGITTMLGFLPGATWSRAYAINERGWIVGDGGRYGFLWRNGVMTALRSFDPSVYNLAWDINDYATIVGEAYDPAQGRARAVMLYPSRLPTDLGGLPGSTDCYARAVNNNLDVAGYCRLATGGSRGFIWRRGIMTQIPLPAGYNFCKVAQMNNNGVVIMFLGAMGEGNDAHIFDGSQTFRFQEALGPEGALWSGLLPSGINDQGEIIGYGHYDTGAGWVRRSFIARPL